MFSPGTKKPARGGLVISGLPCYKNQRRESDMGLTLTRCVGEELQLIFDENMTAADLQELLRDGVTISLRRIHRQHEELQAKLHITAPRSVTVLRAELMER
ncbi:hypothetical protein EQ826_19575 [Ectopseudomonas mendocina]|nr:hypothetical protein EQ828_19915 [Pseudomonas mendocina]TRO22999.1 hypothetical protein EQ826_19575 [Pseudomonas mendocina]